MLISLAQITKLINIQEGDYVLLKERDGWVSFVAFHGMTKSKSISGPLNGRKKLSVVLKLCKREDIKHLLKLMT